MKFMKKLLWVVIAIVLLLLLVGFFLPNKYQVKDTITIDRSPDVVFFHLINFKERSNWDPWLEKDPNAEYDIKITQSGVGTTYKWEGDKIGAGQITVQKVVINERIISNLQFFDNDTSKAKIEWNLKSSKQNQTKVSWQVTGELSGIIEKLNSIFMKGNLKKTIDRGLINLKTYIEGIPKAFTKKKDE